MNEQLQTTTIGTHHVQQTVTYLDSGALFVEFYCCRCQTMAVDQTWFEEHACTEATS